MDSVLVLTGSMGTGKSPRWRKPRIASPRANGGSSRLAISGVVRVLEEILDAAGVEDFSVMTDVSVTLVATDVLRRSRWIDSLG